MERKLASRLLLIVLAQGVLMAQDGSPARTAAWEEGQKRLEAKLDEALKLLSQTQTQVETLTAEIKRLKAEVLGTRVASPSPAAPPSDTLETAAQTRSQVTHAKPAASAFTERILGPGLGEDERSHPVNIRPEIFIQTRYSTLPHKGATIEDIQSNFRLSRIETRWAGRVSDRVGFGLELQYHPAPDGTPEEIVNDAFMEYYLSKHLTLKVGQFIKPFGFDIQQSSAVRESPERAIFAGYFFPGQRDRGVMLLGDLDSLDTSALKNVHYYIGAFNGNRFFVDSNRQLNYIARIRKRFESINLSTGLSVQRGHQLLPAGMTGNNDENVIGVDLQYAYRRLGLRGEFVAGNMPSTLVGLKPRFAPAFRPGRHSSGGAALATYRLTEKDHLYSRYDRFNGDPVSGQNVRAFNVGYFRLIGESSRIAVDYQFKDRLSSNDDAVNTRLQLTWGVTF